MRNGLPAVLADHPGQYGEHRPERGRDGTVLRHDGVAPVGDPVRVAVRAPTTGLYLWEAREAGLGHHLPQLREVGRVDPAGPGHRRLEAHQREGAVGADRQLIGKPGETALAAELNRVGTRPRSARRRT